MKRAVILAIVSFFLLTANISMASVIFYDDAENAPDTSTDWLIRNEYGGDAFSVSTQKARAGNKSYKFVLGGSSYASRVELVLRGLKANPQISNFKWNQEYWMGWSVYIPSDFVFPDNSKNMWGLLGQFHGVSDSCETSFQQPLVACTLNSATSGFKIVVQAQDDRCGVGPASRYETYITPKLKKGAWNDIVLNFKFNYINSGNPFLKMWLNGQLVVDDRGPNCYNDPLSPYFKMGIYSNSTQPMTVYYDEIRVGDENASYADVAPKGSVAADPPQSSTLSPPQLKIVPSN